jgi:predicted RNA-binding protein Jag
MAMIVREFEGRNEKEAIDKAIEELGLDRNEIDFEIVESRKAGLLFRGGKVKIRVHVSEEAPGPAAAGRDLHDEDAKAEAAARQRHGQLTSGEPRQLDEEALEAAVLYGQDTQATRRGGRRDERRRGGGGDNRRGGRGGDRPGEGRRGAELGGEGRRGAERGGEGRRGAGRRDDEERRATPRVPKAPATGEPLEHEQEIVGFVQGVLERMGMQASITVTGREAKRLELDVESDSSGALIGKQGKTLEAFQFLANLAASRFGADSTRVIIDTEDYRARRERALERMANQAAERVRRNRDSTLLEPLNPFERRIVHTALAKRGDVETISEGDGLYKRIRVVWRGKDGGGRDSGGRDSGRGGRREGRGREDRAPEAGAERGPERDSDEAGGDQAEGDQADTATGADSGAEAGTGSERSEPTGSSEE